MACIVEHSGFAYRREEIGSLGIAPRKGLGSRIDARERSKFFHFRGAAILGSESGKSIPARLDSFGQQQMRQIWANEDWKFLKEIIPAAGTAKNSKRQSVKRSVGNHH